MPRLTSKLPSYRLHKPSGRAIVTLDSRDHYLGEHGSLESFEKYKKLLAEWIAKRDEPLGLLSLDDPVPEDLRLDELLLSYLEFAKGYYVKNGKPTGEFTNMKHAVKPLADLYSGHRVSQFGPRHLKSAREAMIRADLSRKVVNARVNRIRRIFKWGVENQLVEPAVLQALQAVPPLKRGRSEARETDRVKPVPEAYVGAVLPLVTRQVRAMIQLQELTGMRPGEVVIMRGCDLDTSGRIWEYRPASHKTEHHGIDRVIFIGPKAQAIIKPFLGIKLEAFLFSPRQAIEEKRKRERRRERQKRRKSRPRKFPGEHYTAQSYTHAIHDACKKAEIPCWGPNRLRHNAATFLRKQYGIEAARVILGHTSAAVTEIYTEVDKRKAADIMAQVG